MKLNHLSRALGMAWRKPFILTVFLLYQAFILLCSIAFESVQSQFVLVAIAKLIVIAIISFYSFRGNRNATFICAVVILLYGLYNLFIGLVLDFSHWILRFAVLTLALYLISAGPCLVLAERRRSRVSEAD